MNERLDFLLSVAIDDELEPAEREELDRLLRAHPEAPARRAQLESVDEGIRRFAAVASADATDAGSGFADAREGEQSSPLERGFERLQARIAERAQVETVTAPIRRRTISRWAPGAAALAAAAAAAWVFFVAPEVTRPDRPGASHSTAGLDADASGSGAAEPWLVDDPIALALVFELDEDAEAVRFVESISPEDLEVIEQLQLLEYLAARETEERG